MFDSLFRDFCVKGINTPFQNVLKSLQEMNIGGQWQLVTSEVN